MDEVRSGGYHISQSDMRAHFGLGEAREASVTITWPDGSEDTVAGLNANTRATVRQGEGLAQAEPF